MQQHVHYDLAQIEEGTRRMFADAKPEDLSDTPSVGVVFKRSVDIEVAVQSFILNEVMRGTNPCDLLNAFEMVMVNLILNHSAHFTSETPGECMICAMLQRIADSVASNHHNGQVTGQSVAHVSIAPVTSGRA